MEMFGPSMSNQVTDFAGAFTEDRPDKEPKKTMTTKTADTLVLTPQGTWMPKGGS